MFCEGLSGIYKHQAAATRRKFWRTWRSVKVIEMGPYPFQRILLISRFFSSPVSSFTVVDTMDAGLDLKLNRGALASDLRFPGCQRTCTTEERPVG
jgi:hypothetical protein